MSNVALTLEQVLEEAGYYARAEERKAMKIARNLLKIKLSIEQISISTGLDIEKVKELAEKENK